MPRRTMALNLVIPTVCDFLIFSCFLHPTRCFSIPSRKASSCLPRCAVGAKRLADLSHNRGFYARSRRACPERSRRNPGDACWQMLFGAFRPQTTREIKKSQPPSVADLSRRAAEGPAVRLSLLTTPLQLCRIHLHQCPGGRWPSTLSSREFVTLLVAHKSRR